MKPELRRPESLSLPTSALEKYKQAHSEKRRLNMDFDESFIKDSEAFLDTVDTMLVDATTYNFFTEYLPESKEQADSFTDKVGSLSKHVVSTELKEAPWGVWGPTTIIKDNVSDEITKLKEQNGKDILIWGSMTLAHSLMKEGLIDEVQLRAIPTTLGKGKPVLVDIL
jgi:dihydrofolate reductase